MAAVALPFMLGSCSGDNQSNTIGNERAIYYWRTVWQPTGTESEFMHKHKINKIYLRFFDVTLQNGEPMPEATMDMSSSLPDKTEIVPVVFVKDECLKDTSIGRLMAKRVLQMGNTMDIEFKEIQVDCDWHERTRKQFFAMIEAMKAELLKHGNFSISSTIRLHQLTQPAPPAEYGMLMCYNTGDLTNIKTKNSVLEVDDVRPYPKNLKGYKLPLKAAYPLFSWKLLFSDGKFISILKNCDLSDTTLFKKENENIYRVIKSHSRPSLAKEDFGMRLFTNDVVKWDHVCAKDIKTIKQLIEKERPEMANGITLYSLNEIDINRYRNEEIESFYTAD